MSCWSCFKPTSSCSIAPANGQSISKQQGGSTAPEASGRPKAEGEAGRGRERGDMTRPVKLALFSKPCTQAPLSPILSFRSSLLSDDRSLSATSLGYHGGSESTLRSPGEASSQTKVLKSGRERASKNIPASSSSSSSETSSPAPIPPWMRRLPKAPPPKKRWFHCPL